MGQSGLSMVRKNSVSRVRHPAGIALMGLDLWLMTGVGANGQEDTIEKGKGKGKVKG